MVNYLFNECANQLEFIQDNQNDIPRVAEGIRAIVSTDYANANCGFALPTDLEVFNLETTMREFVRRPGPFMDQIPAQYRDRIRQPDHPGAPATTGNFQRGWTPANRNRAPSMERTSAPTAPRVPTPVTGPARLPDAAPSNAAGRHSLQLPENQTEDMFVCPLHRDHPLNECPNHRQAYTMFSVEHPTSIKTTVPDEVPVPNSVSFKSSKESSSHAPPVICHKDNPLFSFNDDIVQYDYERILNHKVDLNTIEVNFIDKIIYIPEYDDQLEEYIEYLRRHYMAGIIITRPCLPDNLVKKLTTMCVKAPLAVRSDMGPFRHYRQDDDDSCFAWCVDGSPDADCVVDITPIDELVPLVGSTTPLMTYRSRKIISPNVIIPLMKVLVTYKPARIRRPNQTPVVITQKLKDSAFDIMSTVVNLPSRPTSPFDLPKDRLQAYITDVQN
ncbi:hypothetical protein HDU67_003386, partial [Dinochytrium kinnereticum]